MLQRLFIPGIVVLALATGLGAVAVSAMPSIPSDPEMAPAKPGGPPLGADHITFKVEIPGIPVATFEAVELASEIEVVEFRPGNDTTSPPRKVPGRTTYSNIVLVAKPANAALQALWEWHDATTGGAVDKRDGDIVVVGKDGEEIARYAFFEAWPAKWTVRGVPDTLDSTMEVVELAVERIERQ